MTHLSRPLDFHLLLPRFYCRKVSNQIFEISTLAISDDAGNTQVAASTNKSCLPFRLFEQYFRWIMCSPLFFVSTPLKHCAEITNALWTWVTIFCWNYWKYFHAKSLALKIFQMTKSFSQLVAPRVESFVSRALPSVLPEHDHERRAKNIGVLIKMFALRSYNPKSDDK